MQVDSSLTIDPLDFHSTVLGKRQLDPDHRKSHQTQCNPKTKNPLVRLSKMRRTSTEAGEKSDAGSTRITQKNQCRQNQRTMFIEAAKGKNKGKTVKQYPGPGCFQKRKATTNQLTHTRHSFARWECPLTVRPAKMPPRGGLGTGQSTANVVMINSLNSTASQTHFACNLQRRWRLQPTLSNTKCDSIPPRPGPADPGESLLGILPYTCARK